MICTVETYWYIFLIIFSCAKVQAKCLFKEVLHFSGRQSKRCKSVGQTDAFFFHFVSFLISTKMLVP